MAPFGFHVSEKRTLSRGARDTDGLFRVRVIWRDVDSLCRISKSKRRIRGTPGMCSLRGGNISTRNSFVEAVLPHEETYLQKTYKLSLVSACKCALSIFELLHGVSILLRLLIPKKITVC